jgi:type I restriction enzyme R subunit
MQIAGALEDQQTIPVIAGQLPLIQEIQTDEWWTDVTYPMLDEVRNKLRALVPLIERAMRHVVYTDITDDIGESTDIQLPGTGGAIGSTEFRQFRKKAEHFLKKHLGEASVAKVRSGEPLTDGDLADLQRILVSAGIGGDETFAEASRQAGSFGLFIRSLVGLDRVAAKGAFADFLDDKRYSRNQIHFVNLIIDELTTRGVVEARRVYESPYDGVAPEGPEVMFVEEDLDRLFTTLRELLENAGTTS